MNTLHLFVTTRTDPVDDLDSLDDFAQFKKWEEEVKPHALKYGKYDGMTADFIKDVGNYDILECYAVILYPKGKMLEASNVGNEMLATLKQNRGKLRWKLEKTGKSKASNMEYFTFGMLADPKLKEDEFTIYFEIVSHK
jgi:hypothetical protein